MNKNCPFCKPETQNLAFADENGYYAIYNLSPILPGHSMIIPGRHCGSLFDLSEEEISLFFSFARRVTAFLAEAYEAEAYDWSLQEGEPAGQSIEHLHLHIIPRKPGDLPEGEEWYGKLQQQNSLSIDDPKRAILSMTEYRDISLKLRERWEQYKSDEAK